jgi:hypothetical protein
MRRLSVIAITVCATLAVTVAAEYAWLQGHAVQTSQGMALVESDQAKECAEGGGCAVFSKRELYQIMQAVILRAQGPNS